MAVFAPTRPWPAAAVFRHRFMAPLLAELHASRGGKFVTLVNRTGASRAALRATLDAAITLGWARRNPGHGHPLRPEYLPTPSGLRLGPACAAALAALRALDLEETGLRRWSMPVLRVLDRGPARFAELRRALGPVTDRALATALKELAQAGLIEREVLGSYPPTTLYSCSAAAAPVRGALGLFPASQRPGAGGAATPKRPVVRPRR